MSNRSADRMLTLADGRRLGYAEYGVPDGLPMVYCHGFPGSRREALLAQSHAEALNIRLIAPDRPGMGDSDGLPDRRLADWPVDLGQLVDRLDIDRFHLVGVSGGGPYALACAAAMPERLHGLGLVCALGEMAAGEQVRDMHQALGASVRLYQFAPGFGAWVYERLLAPFVGGHPEQIFDLLLGHAPSADQAVLMDPGVRGTLTDSFRTAFVQGGQGPAHELRIYTAPWHFSVGRIDLPVYLWHGELDPTVPVSMGRRHASLLPSCHPHFFPDEGHFSLVVNHMRDILSALCQARR